MTGDQPANGAESERLGIGLSINFRNVNEENLSEALQVRQAETQNFQTEYKILLPILV